MPCFGPTEEEHRMYERRDGRHGSLSRGELEAVVCGLLRTRKVALDDLDWSEVGVDEAWVYQWWDKHQKFDRLRQEQDARDAAEKEKRERAQLAELKAKYEGDT